MSKFKQAMCLLLSLVFFFNIGISAVALNADFDNDCEYTLEDARAVLEYVTKINGMGYVDAEEADVNRDGYVNTEDVRFILKVVAGHSTLAQHMYTNWVVEKYASCTEDGLESCYCLFCDENFYRTEPAWGHSPVDVTCTKAGYCSTCGVIIDAHGHTFSNQVCTTCGHELTKPQAQIGIHNIYFHSNQATVKEALGEPTEILKDTSTEGNIVIYVYAQDYKNLNILTFLNNKFVELYSNSYKTTVLQGGNEFSLKKTSLTSFGKIHVTPYTDTLNENGEYIYAFCARYNDSYYRMETATNQTANEKLIFHSLNGCRAIYGLPALKYSDKAHQSAYKHSLDMGENDYFDHTNLQGELPWDRMDKEGIEWSYCAENIAAGYRDAYSMNNGWYNSEGHRKAMLHTDLEYIGIGVVYSVNYSYLTYGTQNYFKPIY